MGLRALSIHTKMKVINRNAIFYEIEVEAETAAESLLEEGQFIELCIDGDYKDYKIIKKIGNRFIVTD